MFCRNPLFPYLVFRPDLFHMRVMFLGCEVIGNEISVRFGISDIQIWVHRASIRDPFIVRLKEYRYMYTARNWGWRPIVFTSKTALVNSLGTIQGMLYFDLLVRTLCASIPGICAAVESVVSHIYAGLLYLET